MTADAFALSPMSARASQPSEADYDAIRDAFMETARGRWFLSEYASRNRNADTSMVLDAVARIEASVAQRGPASPSPAALIAVIRPLIAEARAAADAAMAAPDSEEAVAAGRRGARIIREISWSLRETGTDPRICNILDAQLLAIEQVHEDIATDARRELVGEAFDDLILKVEEIDSGARTARHETAALPPEPAESVGVNAGISGLDAGDAPDMAMRAAPSHAATPPDVLATDAVAPLEVASLEVATLPTADEIAADDAVLDRIAMEMAAPEIEEPGDVARDDSAIAELESLADGTWPMAETAAVPVMSAPAPAAPPPPSLGAALIASGIVSTPRAANDALAPFRRMSQSETIAFFS